MPASNARAPLSSSEGSRNVTRVSARECQVKLELYRKRGKNTDPESSSLAGVLEMLQEQNCVMQEQHKAQQKMLLDPIEQQRVAHEQEMRTLKESKGIETKESPKKSFQSQHYRS